MPRFFYESDDELRDAVARLNNLFHDFHQFRAVEARKDHVDEFGAATSAGQMYYKREYNRGYGREIKLSVGSMEKVCAAVLFQNPWAEHNLEVPEAEPIWKYLPEIV